MKNVLLIAKYIFLLLLTGFLLAGVTACGKKRIAIPSRLIIKTSPENAKVYILGEEREKRLRVRPGVYILKFTCPGYKDAWVKAEIFRGKTTEVNFKMERETADVMITSVPAKAHFEFNGKKMGVTPIVLRNLPHGEYSGRLTLPGHAPQDAQWKVSSGTPLLVENRLTNNMGTLSLDSTPSGAQVFLNGKSVGTTPLRDELPAGEYSLALRKKNYADLNRQIVISRGKHLNMGSLNLEILRGSIAVDTIPTGGKLSMNGEEYGVAPYTFKDLLPGRYTIRVEKEGFDIGEYSVELSAGAKLNKMIRLESNRGGVDVITQPANLTIYLDGTMMGVTVPDPSDKRHSKLFSIRNLSAGTHTLMVYHKRGRPQKQQFRFVVQKGRIVRLTNVKLWVPNARITYNDSLPDQEGRILQTFPDGAIFFEPEPKVSTRIAKELIHKIEYLEDVK